MNNNFEQIYLFSIVRSLYYFKNSIFSENEYSLNNFTTFLKNLLGDNEQIINSIQSVYEKKLETFDRIMCFSAGVEHNPSLFKNSGNNQLSLEKIFSSWNTTPTSNNQTYQHKLLNNSNILVDNDLKLLELYSGFVEEVKTLNKNNLLVLAENLLTLIQKYFSFTATYLKQSNSISFFNHTKITSGIFTNYCLSDEKGLLLLGGDVSGIQTFIYDIVNKQAAKNLKGRSFYLQLVVDAIVDNILQQTYPLKSSVVYSSGGSFFLFLPDSESIKNKLQHEIIPFIHKKIFEFHKTSFYVPISYITFQPLDNNSHTSQYWKQLVDKINHQKRTPFKDFLITNYTNFFCEAEKGGYTLSDDFSGQDLDEKDAIVLDDENNVIALHPDHNEIPANSLIISKNHYKILQLAKNLNTAKYILKYKNNTTNNSSQTVNICDLLQIKMSDNIQNEDLTNCSEIQIINPYGNNSFLGNFSHITQTFYFLGGNDFPRNNNKVITDFSDLAHDPNSTFTRIGVLRMDVDNLGTYFANGLPSFAHYSTLSYFLDLFFKYHINHIWNSNKDFKSKSTIIYSGGDDLFIVGKWNVCISFAVEVAKNFKEYSSNALSLSAGISILPNKFPILKAAELAGEEENLAKNHQYNGSPKNSISFFEFPLSFDNEFEIVRKLKDQIYQLLKNNHLKKSTIYKLYSFKQMKDNSSNEISKHQWKWLMAYDFARNNNEYTKDFFNTILQNSITNNNFNSKYHYLDLLVFASKWAELESR